MGKALGLLAAVALVAGPAHAETLGEVWATGGVGAPPPRLVLDQPLETYQVLDDDRDLIVVYVGEPAAAARLQAARFERATRRWTVTRLDWRVAADGSGASALEPEWCRSGLAIEPFPGGFPVRSPLNPCAQCTAVRIPGLSVLAGLAAMTVSTP